MQLDGYYYAMAISVYDCTGCGSCANVCPVNNAGKKAPALVMTSFDDEQLRNQKVWLPCSACRKAGSFLTSSKFQQLKAANSESLTLNSQVLVQVVVKHHTQNLLHSYSVTECTLQMLQVVHQFGVVLHHLHPYTIDANGHGPAWANSLFEDNAEYGLGMFIAQDTLRNTNIA